LQHLLQGETRSVRFMFWTYWLLIVAGLAVYLTVGATHN
jgi:hypothetical protein